MAERFRVERVTQAEQVRQWLPLRHALWPDTSADDHAAEAAALLHSNKLAAFLACVPAPVGFAEASLRHDHVNGCDGSPVVFLEGIYVEPSQRRRGAARALCEAVAQWGRDHGCHEFASDAPLDNVDSHAMHRALGFTESERVVFFRREL